MNKLKVLRYNNRKLYIPKGTPGHSAGYVNVSYLVSTALKGQLVEIIDKDTGSDCTYEILARGIVDVEAIPLGDLVLYAARHHAMEMAVASKDL